MGHCLYCSKYLDTRKAAYSHLEKMHSRELDRDGYTVAQACWLGNHGSLQGKCMVCGRTTEFNPSTGQPFKMCTDPECKAKMKAQYDINLKNKRGIDQHTLMSDIERQKNMLSNRKISGKYKFADGGEVEYTGKLELNFLQFCDTILELKSWQIVACPEVFTYTDPKDDQVHQYIPDAYLPDYNLIVEIKDGGDHPNENPEFIKETKYKVALKDNVMKNQTKYNYIRISGKQYGPFLETLYQIVHEQEPDEKKRKNLVVITESACVEDIDSDVNWNQTEQVNPNRVKILIGYDEHSNMPLYVAITDSMINASWFVSDIENAQLYECDYTNPLLRSGKYVMYAYAGDTNKIQDAFGIIMTNAHRGEDCQWHIPTILLSSGIYLDDGNAILNNVERRMDFIRIETWEDDNT